MPKLPANHDNVPEPAVGSALTDVMHPVGAREVAAVLSGPPGVISFAMKYCNHHKVHGCTELVAAMVKYCGGCNQGQCGHPASE